MSDSFRITRIRPAASEGVPRTSKQQAGIQKRDIATEGTEDFLKQPQREKKRNHPPGDPKRGPSETPDSSATEEGIIDIIV